MRTIPASIDPAPRKNGLPFGRQVADFEPLSPIEAELVRCASAGEACQINENRPLRKGKRNLIRAALIRCLLLGGDADHPVHEVGIWVVGAFIEGVLDLSMALVAHRLVAEKCHFEREILMRDAAIPFLALNDCNLRGLSADRIDVRGGIQLRDRTLCQGEIRLISAKIGENLDCTDSTFNNPEGYAVLLDRAVIDGSTLMRGAFKATGEVSLIASQIGESLICTGGTFEAGRSGDALSADRAKVNGNVFLRDGFTATGCVRVLDAVFRQDLECFGCRIIGQASDVSLSAGGVLVGGRFSLERATVEGVIDLHNAEVGVLNDRNFDWPANGYILSGLRIGRIGAGSVDAANRSEWLKQQLDLGDLLEPLTSPWLEMVRVLKSMGYSDESRKLAVSFERFKAKIAGPFSPRSYFSHMRWLFNGYGYYPFRSIFWPILISIMSCAAYYYGGSNGYFGPSNALILLNDNIASSCGITGELKQRWTKCDHMPEEYTTFHPLMYALDLAFPFVDLQQDKDWAPVVSDSTGAPLKFGGFLRILMWFQILLGWAVGTYIVAVATKLVEDD